MLCANCETETADIPCPGCGADPQLAGKYQLQRVLGRGAQGTTFVAKGPNGICAVKELQLGRAAGGKATELFHREAAVLAQLSHDNIPDLYDHFVSGVGVARSLYVVQQFISGQNLEDRLATHRFTEPEVEDIVAQVAGILDYLHGLSPPVIHRDIKPSNLILDDNGNVHLIDFGAVRDVMRDSVGGGSTVAGTFGYMAPEQLVGDATPQSDLYALGATAMRLLTREHPTALADRMGNFEWRHRASVSKPFANWVDSLVNADPAKRPTTASRPPVTSAIPLAPPSASHAPRTATIVERPWLDVFELLDRIIARRQTDATIHIAGGQTHETTQQIAGHLAQALAVRQRPQFVPHATSKEGWELFKLTATVHRRGATGRVDSQMMMQLRTNGQESRLRIRQTHSEGSMAMVLAAAVPVVVVFGAISLATDSSQSVGDVQVFMAGTLLLVLVAMVLAIVGWGYSSLLASRSKAATSAFIQTLLQTLNHETSEVTQSLAPPLPMEERHPEPVAFDMSGPPKKTRQ